MYYSPKRSPQINVLNTNNIVRTIIFTKLVEVEIEIEVEVGVEVGVEVRGFGVGLSQS